MPDKNAISPKHEAESAKSPATEASGRMLDSAKDDIEMNRVEKIRDLAYSFYEARACVEGYALEDWLKAEACVMEMAQDTEQLPVPA